MQFIRSCTRSFATRRLLGAVMASLLAFSSVARAEDPTSQPVADVVADDASTPEKLLMFVKPGTMLVGRVDLGRCDPRDALALLSTMIETSPADVPYKAKMAQSLRREAGREVGDVVRDAREAGVLEMIGMAGGFMNFDPESNGMLFRIRDGADVDAALKALQINREYMNVTVEGNFIVCRYNFGARDMKPMMNAARTNRAEVLKAVEIAGDAPAMMLFVPPAGSLNLAKMAMPTLPDYLGAVETKDLVDGVDALVIVGDLKDIRGRATVVCANPQVFADAVSKMRTGFVDATKDGTAPIDGMPTAMQSLVRALCEHAPALEVKEGAVELNVDEPIIRKNLDAMLPHIVEEFKDGARRENEQNMQALLAATTAFAAEHNDALPRTLEELKPYLAEHEDFALVSTGMLDDKPYVYRRPAGAGLLAPLSGADNVVLLHEQLDGRDDADSISYGLTNGNADSCSVTEFKQRLANGTLKLADGAGGQGG